MAKLHSEVSLSRIELEGEEAQYYNSVFKDRWQEAMAVLKEFGITFPSEYEVNFEGDGYKIQSVPQHFGAQNIRVLYQGTVIADARIDGGNVGDREGKLIVYIKCLQNVYKKS